MFATQSFDILEQDPHMDMCSNFDLSYATVRCLCERSEGRLQRHVDGLGDAQVMKVQERPAYRRSGHSDLQALMNTREGLERFDFNQLRVRKFPITSPVKRMLTLVCVDVRRWLLQ